MVVFVQWTLNSRKLNEKKLTKNGPTRDLIETDDNKG